MNRWAKSGGLARVFAQLQQAPIIRVQLEAVALDSTIVTVHPEGTGAFQQMARQPSAGRVVGEPPRCIWLPRMRERPCRLPCRQARPTMPQRGVSGDTASGNDRPRFPC